MQPRRGDVFGSVTSKGEQGPWDILYLRTAEDRLVITTGMVGRTSFVFFARNFPAKIAYATHFASRFTWIHGRTHWLAVFVLLVN